MLGLLRDSTRLQRRRSLPECLHEVLLSSPSKLRALQRTSPARCQTARGVREFVKPGGTFWIISDGAGLKIDKTSQWSVSRMFLVSGLLSFFTASSVFFPSSRAAVDQCQSPVCRGGVLTRLSQLGGEAAARWPLTSESRSLSDWCCLRRGRSERGAPRGSSRGHGEELRASVLPFPTSTPTDRSTGRRRAAAEEEE